MIIQETVHKSWQDQILYHNNGNSIDDTRSEPDGTISSAYLTKASSAHRGQSTRHDFDT